MLCLYTVSFVLHWQWLLLAHSKIAPYRSYIEANVTEKTTNKICNIFNNKFYFQKSVKQNYHIGVTPWRQGDFSKTRDAYKKRFLVHFRCCFSKQKQDVRVKYFLQFSIWVNLSFFYPKKRKKMFHCNLKEFLTIT